jgi:hypothetical protein
MECVICGKQEFSVVEISHWVCIDCMKKEKDVIE